MEVINAAGKRVSLLNEEDPLAAVSQRTTALPLHRGPPTPPQTTNAASAATYLGAAPPASLPRPALDLKPSYSSSRSSSSVTTTTSSSSSSSYPSSSSSALHHNHPHQHHHNHHRFPTHHLPTPSSSSNKTSTAAVTSESDIHSPHDSRQSPSSVNSPRYSPASRAVPQLLRHDSTSSSQSLSTPKSPMTPTTYYEPLDQGKGINGDPALYSFATHPAAIPPGIPHGVPTSSDPLSQQALLANAAFYPPSTQVPLTSVQGLYPNFATLQQPLVNDPYGMAAPAVQYQYATDLIDTLAPAAGLPAGPLGTAAGLNGVPVNGSASSVDGSVNGANGNAQQQQLKAKKKYPCPHAARFNCPDTFTTSGHAARHGKKHTGEKNILCPTCHKAFTRKDNMKQHERTHKNRNNHSNSHSADESKNTSTNGHSRRTQSISSVAASTLTHKSSGSTEMELDSPITDSGDSKRNSLQRPSLSRPGQYVGGSPISGNDVKFDHAQHRPELSRQFSGETQDGEGESPGLDALAMAATVSDLR